ncbi:MAG: hypothetical protein JWQ78_1544, partial [Sediminibacterium sp.]|nr:hypothetical protein [Sediminibacterium sp.]
MKKPVALIIAFLLIAGLGSHAQKITYTEPDRDDSRTMNFEVIGKMNGKILVYKNYRDLHFIATYDNDMKAVEKVKLDFLNYRVLNSEFIQYSDYLYMIYQFQRRSVMYCMAVKLDGSGKKLGEPIQLDSTDNINYSANNKIYSVINSDDKQKIMIFKINTKNDKSHVLTTVLFNKDLTLLKKTRLSINMPQRNDFLSEFTLDNDGDMVCVKASGTATNDNINKITLISKPALSDGFTSSDLKVAGIYLDD